MRCKEDQGGQRHEFIAPYLVSEAALERVLDAAAKDLELSQSEEAEGRSRRGVGSMRRRVPRRRPKGRIGSRPNQGPIAQPG
jgi:hypothetical protein